MKAKLLSICSVAMALCSLLAEAAIASEDTERLNGFWMCVQGSDYQGKGFNVRDGLVSLISPEGSAALGRIDRVDGNDIYILGESPYPDDRIRFLNYNWIAMGEGPSLVVCRREDWREYPEGYEQFEEEE